MKITTLKSIAITTALSLVSSAAMAMSVNLSFSDDIIANDKLNVAQQILTGAYPHIQKQEFALDGIDRIAEFAKAYAGMFSSTQPVNDPFTGEISYITLGYSKNGSTVVPASCQKMDISNRSVVNIYMTEAGCTVS